MSVLRNLLIEKAKNEPIWLEYLESTGTQYIDTGIKPESSIMKYSYTIQETNIVSGNSLFGCQTPWSGIFYTRGLVRVLYIGSTAQNSYNPDKNKHSFLLEIDDTNKVHSFTEDSEVLWSNNSYSGTIIGTRNIYIFCNNYSGSPSQLSKFKLYSFKIYSNNILVRNFRPCLNPITLRPALYDVVNNQYYYNQGTGEFQYNQ